MKIRRQKYFLQLNGLIQWLNVIGIVWKKLWTRNAKQFFFFFNQRNVFSANSIRTENRNRNHTLFFFCPWNIKFASIQAHSSISWRKKEFNLWKSTSVSSSSTLRPFSWGSVSCHSARIYIVPCGVFLAKNGVSHWEDRFTEKKTVLPALRVYDPVQIYMGQST